MADTIAKQATDAQVENAEKQKIFLTRLFKWRYTTPFNDDLT
jgi:hypothetical protein